MSYFNVFTGVSTRVQIRRKNDRSTMRNAKDTGDIEMTLFTAKKTMTYKWMINHGTMVGANGAAEDA